MNGFEPFSPPFGSNVSEHRPSHLPGSKIREIVLLSDIGQSLAATFPGDGAVGPSMGVTLLKGFSPEKVSLTKGPRPRPLGKITQS